MEHLKDAALGQTPVLLEKCIAKGKTLWLTFASLSATAKKSLIKLTTGRKTCGLLEPTNISRLRLGV
jgi:hypothetical protein